MDGPVHAAAARELRVRGVDDRVDGLLGDVALQQRDPRHGRIVTSRVGHQAYVDGDRVRQRVADRRGGDDLLVHELQRLGVRVGVDAHADVEPGVAGVAGREAEEGPQVELAGDPDLEVVDGDPAGRELRDVADRQAVAERRGELLHGVGRGVAAGEALRLVGRHRVEPADRGLGAEAAAPADVGLPDGGGVRRVLVDGVDERRDGGEVEVVQPGSGGHACLLGGRRDDSRFL